VDGVMWAKMNRENGYVLPFVMMISTLILFILSHQVTIYVTEIKFYKEKAELYAIERILQKSVIDLQQIQINDTAQSKELKYDEGKAILQINATTLPVKTINIKVETNEQRKSTVIVHYDTVNFEIVRWIEVR
jgi:hypothetical protein